MAKTITTRLPEEYVLGIGEIAEIENLDTSGVIRKLLARAIEEWKKEYAVEKYKQGEFSFGQSAKFANVSVWDFPLLLKEKKVPLNMDVEEFKEELNTVQWLMKKKKR
jgi:predicted HTH domain antitoxin